MFSGEKTLVAGRAEVWTMACLLLLAGCGPRDETVSETTRAPLPAALASMACEDKPPYYHPGHYNLVVVEGTTLVVPCEKQGDVDAYQKAWAMSGREGRHMQAISFVKRPDGVFERGSAAFDPTPSASVARYALTTSVRPHRPEQWERPIEGGLKRWEIGVPTPAAFSPTGPTTTFVCFGPMDEYEKYQTPRRCRARVRSKSLYWDVNISFGFFKRASLQGPKPVFIPPATAEDSPGEAGSEMRADAVPPAEQTAGTAGAETRRNHAVAPPPVAPPGEVTAVIDTRDPELTLATLESLMPGDLREAYEMLAIHVLAQE